MLKPRTLSNHHFAITEDAMQSHAKYSVKLHVMNLVKTGIKLVNRVSHNCVSVNVSYLDRYLEKRGDVLRFVILNVLCLLSC